MRWCVLVCLLALGAGCDGALRFAEDSDASTPVADAASTSCPAACGAGTVCVPALQQCAVTCSEGDDEHVCPASAPTCNEKAKYCVSCTSDAQCAAITDDGEICDTSSGQCVHCLADDNCSDLQPRCDPSSQKCVECLTSSDCPDEDTCDPTQLTCD